DRRHHGPRRGGHAIPVVPPAPYRRLPPPSVATRHTTTPRSILASSQLCLLLVVASRSPMNALPPPSMHAERRPRNYLAGHRRSRRRERRPLRCHTVHGHVRGVDNLVVRSMSCFFRYAS